MTVPSNLINFFLDLFDYKDQERVRCPRQEKKGSFLLSLSEDNDCSNTVLHQLPLEASFSLRISIISVLSIPFREYLVTLLPLSSVNDSLSL